MLFVGRRVQTLRTRWSPSRMGQSKMRRPQCHHHPPRSVFEHQIHRRRRHHHHLPDLHQCSLDYFAAAVTCCHGQQHQQQQHHHHHHQRHCEQQNLMLAILHRVQSWSTAFCPFCLLSRVFVSVWQQWQGENITGLLTNVQQQQQQQQQQE